MVWFVEASYENLVEEFKDAEENKQCRYAVFDADYELKDGQKRSKLVFFLWYVYDISFIFVASSCILFNCYQINQLRCGSYRSPENAAIKQKMIYTSSKDTLKRALVGIGKDVQACDYGDLAWSNILEILLRTETAQ